ncbi:MAG TPA: polysaccharide deacetylase family protein [Ohtaekwangia sp.]|nr:polysaccharide deacetylase family protein [Ohtaekwangia sp.]
MLTFKRTKNTFWILTVVLLVLNWLAGISLWWSIGVLAFFLLMCTIGSFVAGLQFFLPAITKGKMNSGTVAITFDDGPVYGKTNEILEILRQHNVPATFFCIGSRIVRESGTIQKIHAEGHLIGNHSYSHRPGFGFFSTEKVRRELADTDRAIEGLIGNSPRFFRPPFGVTNPMIAKATKGSYTVVGWSIRSFDTVIRNPQRLLKRVSHTVESGDIILFHDYSDAMLKILPQCITEIKNKGLKIVRLDVLLNQQGYR